MTKYKFDNFDGLRAAWDVCVQEYLHNKDKESRRIVIDDFVDSLVDIKNEGNRALYSNFNKWEKTEWIPLCKSKLNEWIKYNPFEARVENNKIQEYNNIKNDYNFQRYHKILQLIQDSGIGFGQGREVKTIDRKGFQDGK